MKFSKEEVEQLLIKRAEKPDTTFTKEEESAMLDHSQFIESHDCPECHHSVTPYEAQDDEGGWNFHCPHCGNALSKAVPIFIWTPWWWELKV